MRQQPWNKCQDCGRFIAYEEFEDGTAVHKFISPLSEFSDERYETYHLECKPVRKIR